MKTFISKHIIFIFLIITLYMLVKMVKNSLNNNQWTKVVFNGQEEGALILWTKKEFNFYIKWGGRSIFFSMSITFKHIHTYTLHIAFIYIFYTHIPFRFTHSLALAPPLFTAKHNHEKLQHWPNNVGAPSNQHTITNYHCFFSPLLIFAPFLFPLF